MKEVIINGKKLAKYLEDNHVQKNEFLQAMNSGNPYRTFEEDGLDIVDGQDDDLGFELFELHVTLESKSAKRFFAFIDLFGAEKIIDWGSMEIERANFNRLFQMLGMFKLANANIRYAI